MRSAWFGVGMAALVAAAPAEAVEPEAPLAGCGHSRELADAERALEEGRSDDALVHLRNADRLLARCQRESRPVREEAPGAPRETADAGRNGVLPAPPPSV